MVPTRIRNMRINRADTEDVRWLEETLNREGRDLGTIAVGDGGLLKLRW